MIDQPDPAARRSTPGRLLVGAALGVMSWPVDVIAAVVAAIVAASRPSAGLPVFPGNLVGWHRRRTVRYLGWTDAGAATQARRAAAYLLCRAIVGVVGIGVLTLLAYGLFAAVVGALSWLFDIRLTVTDPLQDGQVTTATVLVLLPAGLVLLYLDLMGLAGVGLLDRAAAARWLAPSRRELLEREVENLTISRADLLSALDAERARIERDLHDGVQQRAVAVGLLVGRARRLTDDDAPARRLLEHAAQEAERLLSDLRDAAWRVRPTALDTHGLATVLQQLVDRTSPPTALEWPSPERLPAQVETTLYYVVAEALTNVSRHARATSASVRVEVDDADGTVSATVRDDGVGGASARPGHGLAGLGGRVAAARGTLAIDSPAGGPTTLEVVLPCV